MRALIIALLLSLLFANPVIADAEKEVLEISKQKIVIVINHLKDKEINKKERNKRISGVVNSIFDFQRMAIISLGKKHWVTMNKEQKKEFSKLFAKRLMESFMSKLDLYVDEEVAIEEAVQVRNRVHVQTHLLLSDRKMEMVYKYYKSKKKGWKVYDVVIQGVSTVQTYRSQFNGLLRKGTIDDILEMLSKTEGILTPTK